MSAVIAHLNDLYAQTDDPWNFDTSAYEQARFRATRDALPRDRYRAALEIGCGNGALARHLAPICGSYTGIDTVARAVAAAQVRVPAARFIQATYPCDLAGSDYDLIILSEVLYFLTPAVIRHLARNLVAAAPGADLVCVSYLGDTAQALQGRDALAILQAALSDRMTLEPVVDTGGYRIDRGVLPS